MASRPNSILTGKEKNRSDEPALGVIMSSDAVTVWLAGGGVFIALLTLVFTGQFERLSWLRRRAGLIKAEAEVVVAVVNHNGRVLLVHRKPVRPPTLHWQFPSANLRPGEDPAAIAVKEVAGETGVTAKAIRSLGIRRHPLTKKWCEYIACEWVAGEGVNRDTDENIYVRWVEKGDVTAYIQSDLFGEVKKWLN
jgi:8-oxo-dGTP pyrophosphatase MutT (NUDIX family)